MRLHLILFRIFLEGPLAFLVNKIFQKGKFSDNLTTVVIKPMYKNDENYNIVNYKQILIVNTITKAIEKAIKKRITEFSETNNILKYLKLVYYMEIN